MFHVRSIRRIMKMKAERSRAPAMDISRFRALFDPRNLIRDRERADRVAKFPCKKCRRRRRLIKKPIARASLIDARGASEFR